MNSKGQVTVFIIVGIIILAVAAIILYVTSITITEEIETEGKQFIETVPQEFIAIQQYTEACLNSVAEQGIIVLGQQGGYLYPSSLGDYSITNPTDSVGVNLDPVLVPYWHYNANPNGEPAVAIATLQPALYDEDDSLAGGTYMSVESQLGRYVEEEMERCLNSYEVFSGQGFVIDYDQKAVTARVWDGYVDFTLEMPMVITREDSTAEMTQFYAELDVDLKHVYEVAADITDAEQNYTFLENQALELIHVHARLDGEALAPLNSMTISERPEPVYWFTADIKQKLKSILSSYVPVLRYQGSKDFYRFEYQEDKVLSDLYQRISDNMIIPMDGAEDLSVRFSYLGWEPYLDMNGGQEKIGPTGFFMTSPFTEAYFSYGYEQYYNTYDLSYPVLVTIEDEDSFNGKGYTFNFALESNLVNNGPIEEGYVQPTPIASGGASSLGCNEEQQNTELVQTIVVDAYTYEPLELVAVSLKIPGSDYCNMGETDNSGVLESEYPAVYGGMIELNHDDYATTNYMINTYDYFDTSGLYGFAVGGFDYEVLPIYQKKEVDVTVKGIFAKKCVVPKVCNKKKDDCDDDATRICFSGGEEGTSLFLGTADFEQPANGSVTYWNEYYFTSGGVAPLRDSMQATFMIEKVDGLENETGEAYHSTFVSVIGGETTTIELIPGIYKVEAFLQTEESININDDERCYYDEDGDGKCDDTSGMYLDSYVAGTMSWDDESTYFVVEPDDLYNNDQLELYVLGMDYADVPLEATSYNENDKETTINALVMEDLTVSAYFNDISQQSDVRKILEPEWSSSLEGGVVIE